MTDWITQVQTEAAERVAREISKPNPIERDDIGDESVFYPWAIFPAVYGNYSSAFDEAALVVLRNLLLTSKGEWDNLAVETLAHEMIREMLCVSELCEYGTSPRTCWATHRHFAPLLPTLIEKWQAYYRVHWGEEPPKGEER